MIANETEGKVLTDLKRVVQDSEGLLIDSAGAVGEKAHELREQLARKLDVAKATCRQLEEKTREAAKATDKLIRDHPYPSLGIAFGVGIAVGFLLKRK
jgi:ElaB/YqjD/DUF883 family membrane-anchored ribosome-binding protein